MRAAIVVVAVLLALTPFFGLPSSSSAANDKKEKDDELIMVRFKDGVSEDVKNKVHKDKGGEVKREIKGLDVKVVKVPKGKTDEKILEYQQDPNVEYAEPVGIAYPDWTPNDQRYAEQWGLNNTGQAGGKVDADIDAPGAWDVTRGLPSSDRGKIAIVDTGIHKSHPDLEGKIDRTVGDPDSNNWPDERNWAVDHGPTEDVYGHGTHVAGIAAARTNTSASSSPGIAGVCPDCNIVNAKVCTDDGSCPYDFIANGVLWAVGCDYRDANGNCLNPMRARSINISLTGGFASRTLQNAIDKAWSRGAVISCAAGNSGNTTRVYPAAFTNCIAVAATDKSDAIASFSNRGGSWVDMAAPGVGILSTVTSNGYEAWNGTSMASPHVAGAAALVWSSGLCSSPSCVRNRLETYADPISGTGSRANSLWSKGRLNACRAVSGPKC